MTAQDVGRALREQREQRGLKLERAAEATHIRKHYLQALEDGDFGALPSAAQVRGFLRAYASYLDLNADELLAKLSQPVEAEAAPAGDEAAGEPESQPAKTPPAGASGEAPAEFAAIGAELRTRRERMELSLSEVEQNTHIPEHYLARLEKGQFDSFPSPTQARGMLGNYAEFLGLESEALLLQYAEALQARFQQRAAAKPEKPKRERPSLPPLKFRLPDWAQPLLTRDIAFGALAGFALLAFLLFSVGRVLTTRAEQQAQPTAPPLGSLLLPSSTPGASPSPAGTGESINLLGQATATPGLLGEATIQVTSGGNINLRLLSLQRAWMRVTVDGNVQFEGRTAPGQSYAFSANGQILLLTGNGAGLRAFLNDQDLGIVGVLGEVVSVVFNAQGASTPTLSPTPTIDPNVLTATADFLLTPSATPSPTATETPAPAE
jgi:cytoskeletal protein RodZ